MKKMIISIGMGLVFSGCSVFGIRTTPEPDYKVLEKDGNKEVRLYPSLLIAQTFSKGNYKETSNQEFRILADYIFGKNEKNESISMTAPVMQKSNDTGGARESEKIGMTAPVFQTKNEEGWHMSFVMPKRYTLENLPKPIDERIEIIHRPSLKIASLRYTGILSQKKIDKNRLRLAEWIKKRGYASLGNPFSAGYDPPWTIPFLRRNEVQIEIEP